MNYKSKKPECHPNDTRRCDLLELLHKHMYEFIVDIFVQCMPLSLVE